jgi:hypothetical protein
MRKLASALILTAGLSACAAPAVVGFNGDSVTVRTSTNLPSDVDVASRQATGICSKVGKQAEYASTTYVHDLNIQHLFLCL